MLKNLGLSLTTCAGLLSAVILQPYAVSQAQTLATPAAVTSTDPSSQQIFEAARAGNLAQAQQMIERVLHDYPRSARAHYVAAEVYARSGDLSRARSEFTAAQSLSPGLSFASPRAVQELQQQLTGAVAGTPPRQSHGISWGGILLIGALGALIFALLRRRSAPSPYAPTYGQSGAYSAGPYPGAGAYGPTASGGGSGLMGSLATGLAVGAGVAAGEQLVEHVLRGSSSGVAPGTVVPSAEAGDLSQVPNADMGGNNFGLSGDASWDGGSGDSWGSDGGGGDFGGGDWT